MKSGVSSEKLRPGDLLSQISAWKSQSVLPDDAGQSATTDKQILSALAYGKYRTALRASGAMDFDDLLLLTEQLFTEHPAVRQQEAGRFDHLLIDEYQDTNGLQYRIVKALAEGHRNLCVVGDDDQSIYGWRGAEVEHILNFSSDWPEAKVVRLEANYRSREAILKLANVLIAHNSTRHDKVLRPYRKGGEPPRFVRFEDENAEATAVVREIHQRVNAPPPDRAGPQDFAILFRTNEQPRAFEMELRRANIPYVLVGGQSFYDRKEVRDIMAYLKVLAHPGDEVSLLRIINTPSRGIGSSTIQALLAHAVERGEPLWNVLDEACRHGDISAAARQRVDAFRQMIRQYRQRLQHMPLVDLVSDLIQEIDYKGELERLASSPADVEVKFAAVEEVVNAIGSYAARTEGPTLFGFLEETALAGREDLKDDNDKKQPNAVTLMTLHSAKGLEFPHVYMVGMEEGLLPHSRSLIENRSIDEERRLCYVGVTRARDTLTLTFCKGRMKWGKLRPSIPSRFLMEMRGETDRAQRAAQAGQKAALAAAEAKERAAKKIEKRQETAHGRRFTRPIASTHLRLI